MSFINIFGGSTIQPAQVSYLNIPLSASVELEWPWVSTTPDGAVARIMEVTPSVAGLSITMPDARSVSPGYDFLIGNSGAYAFTLKNNVGGTLVSIDPGAVKYVVLTDNSTAAGTWYVLLFGVSASALDAASLAGPGLIALGSKLARSEPVTLFSVGNTVTIDDRAKVFVWTGGVGTQTLPLASSVGASFSYELRNQGTGVLTLDADASDSIDAAPSIILQPTESVRVHSSGGTAWYTVGRGRSTQFQYSFMIKSITGGTVTLTSTEASNTVQRYTGTLVSHATVIVPPVVQVYYISNQTAGAFNLTFSTGLGGTTVAIPQGQNAILFCDGVNIINTTTSVASISTLLLEQGTVSTPSLAYIGDVSTGLYQPAISQMAVTISGSQVVLFSASGVAVTGLVTANGLELGYRKVPAASVTTGSVAAQDSGKCVFAAGGVTIPNSTFTQGDCVTIYNNTGGNVTITAGVTTLRLAGTASTGNRTLAQRGVATVLFISGTEAVISGGGLT